MDVDIDLPTTFEPMKWFKTAVPASMTKKTKDEKIPDLVKHPCGHYFQAVPIDPVTHLSAIPFKEAEDLGYFKIDMLHLGLLDTIKSKMELRLLMRKEPDWSLLDDEDVVEKLFHLSKHYLLVNRVKPKSVQELADCMALIRPGRKHLVDRYIGDREEVREYMLYIRTDDDEYTFKRSHAIAYAFNVVLQLHLIKQGRL